MNFPPDAAQLRWPKRLPRLSSEYYPTNVFSEVPEIERMDQLVEFTAEIAGLRQAVPAFL